MPTRRVTLGGYRRATSATGGNVASSGGALASAYRAGQWYVPPVAPSTAALAAGSLSVTPLHLVRTGTVTDLAFEVTVGAASSFVRVVIYADDGTGYPGALLYDSGQIDTSVLGVKTHTLVTPLALAAGFYWIGGVSQGGTPTVRINGAAHAGILSATAANALASQQAAYSQFSVTGAPPATFSTTVNSNTSSIRVAAKLG